MMGQVGGGGIWFIKMGRQRLTRFAHLMEKKQREAESQKAMEALVLQSQELGLGYGCGEPYGFVDGYLIASSTACDQLPAVRVSSCPSI
nr:hypothetical protein [uncultured Pseudomonas sp.]